MEAQYRTSDGEIVTAFETVMQDGEDTRRVWLRCEDRPPEVRVWTMTWPDLKAKVASNEWEPIDG